MRGRRNASSSARTSTCETPRHGQRQRLHLAWYCRIEIPALCLCPAMHSHLAGAVRYLTLRSLPRVLSLSSLSCSLRVSASAAYLRRLTSSPLLSSSLHAPNCPHSKLSPAAMAEAAAARKLFSSLFFSLPFATCLSPTRSSFLCPLLCQ